MIQTTDEFHEVANGQVRPLDWESAIAFKMTEGGGSYEIEGTLSQNHTYSGKNLFNPNPQTTDRYGITTTYNAEEQTITLNGTSTVNNNIIKICDTITLPDNATYTLSYEVLSGSVSGINNDDTKIQLQNNPSWYGIWIPLRSASRKGSRTGSGTFNENNIRVENGVRFDNFTIRLQLEKNANPTAWERYVGGVPSPSPLYPEPITIKTGNIVVDYDNLQFPISLGDIELAKIGNYADRIYKSNDTWYIEKQVRHLSLPITAMDNNEDYPGWKNVPHIREDIGTGKNQSIYSLTSTTNNLISAEVTRMNTTSEHKIIFFPKNSAYPYWSQTQWKENLPDEVFELYYVIKNQAEWTHEEITDENLIKQLNAPLLPRPDYMDVKNRTISVSTSRSVEFPHTVQSATCDLELDNHDRLFSYSNHSDLGPYILPNRPMAIELGFKEVGTVPHFYGNTIMPKYQGEFEEVATFTANDDLSKLGENHLPNMIMLRDARTDEAIEAILVDLGVPSDKYELEEGVNRIPFVYFDADKSVGNALKELVQAENGALWQDEKGIIRFAARNTNAFSQDPVMVFDKTNTISVQPSHVDNIVNSVSITADIRKVEPRQQIFTADNANGFQSDPAQDNYRVAANGMLSIWLSLDDPTWTCSNPVLNGPANSSTFTAVDLSGNAVESRVTATGTLFATSYKVDFINTNSFPVSINQITLWGEPAKLIGGQAVEYFATDDESVERFGTYQLDISDNNCFGSVDNMKRYAIDILNKYADYNAVVKLEAKCDPALQLGDVVYLAIEDYTGRYSIRGIDTQLTASGLSTSLTLNLLVGGEVGPFILDQSVLDGPDLLG